MVQHCDVTEVEIDERSFMVRPVGSWVLESGNVVAEALAVMLDKPLEWAVGFFFGNVEPSLELWNIIPGISGISDYFSFCRTWYQSARGRTALRRFYWWRSTIAATNAPGSIVVRPEAGA